MISSGIFADGVVAERDRVIDQGVQIIRHRPERIFLDRLALRPAEVRHQNRLRALFAQVIDRRQTFPDPRVVCDDDLAVALFGRNIEIDAHEHAFSADFEIAKGELGHYSPLSRNRARAPARFRIVPRLPAKTRLVPKSASAFPSASAQSAQDSPSRSRSVPDEQASARPKHPDTPHTHVLIPAQFRETAHGLSRKTFHSLRRC